MPELTGGRSLLWQAAMGQRSAGFDRQDDAGLTAILLRGNDNLTGLQAAGSCG